MNDQEESGAKNEQSDSASNYDYYYYICLNLIVQVSNLELKQRVMQIKYKLVSTSTLNSLSQHMRNNYNCMKNKLEKI